jgi:glycosyltransferase involved in cell wall biosynthesis
MTIRNGESILVAPAPTSISDQSAPAVEQMNLPRVRVAILDHTAILGGGEIALLNLARSIDVRQYELLVILFSDGPLKVKLQERGIDTLVLPLDPRIVDVRKEKLGGATLLRLRDAWISLKFTWKLSHELRRRKIQIVHTNSLKSDLIGGVAARLAWIPVIWHVRDRIADDYLPRSVVRAFRFLAHLIPQRVIANSFATMGTLGLRGSAPKDVCRFCVVHDGAEVFDEPPAVAGEHLTIGLVGRISPWKGQHIFLQAIRVIRARFPQARFQIIGAALFSETDYEKQMCDLAVSLGISDIVDFLGFRNDVMALVDRMDVLVHASTIGEPFGQVVLEGMAAGKAVVATRGGGVPEFVTDGVTGLLVPMGDAQAMADAMARLLSDRALRTEIGRRARQQVIDGFTVQHTALNVQKVYQGLILSPRRI